MRSQRAERVYDKENYIDFRMRLLGEPGNEKKLHYGTFNAAVKSKRPRYSSDNSFDNKSASGDSLIGKLSLQYP